MRGLVIAWIAAAGLGGCSLLVETEGLSTSPDSAELSDASIDTSSHSNLADAPAEGGDEGDGGGGVERTFTVGSTAEIMRVSGTVAELPAKEVNAGHGTFGILKRTGVRFVAVQVPARATIESAHVVLTSAEAQAGATTSTGLWLEASDNALPWVGTVADFDKRMRTGAVAWASMSDWVSGVEYETPELAPLVQLVVDRPGWTSGNAIVVFWEDMGSIGDAQQRVAFASPLSPTLTIRFR